MSSPPHLSTHHSIPLEVLSNAGSEQCDFALACGLADVIENVIPMSYADVICAIKLGPTSCLCRLTIYKGSSRAYAWVLRVWCLLSYIYKMGEDSAFAVIRPIFQELGASASAPNFNADNAVVSRL